MVLVIRGLLAGGTLLLLVSILPVRRIIGQLPRGRTRGLWMALAALISFFIAGYLLYAASIWDTPPSFTETVVALVFFFGACFVWLVNTLSLQTTGDVRRMASLEKETITDALSGIFNRRHFDQRLEEEVSRTRRHGLPLAVLLLDIDRFKDINDAMGHLSGDFVLGRIAKLVLETTRATDIVARYGGDEIAIVATNTSGPAALALAERIRQGVESLSLNPPLSQNGASAINPTVSVGVACLQGGIANAAQMVSCADAALYRAKQGGRNRVEVCEGQAPAVSGAAQQTAAASAAG